MRWWRRRSWCWPSARRSLAARDVRSAPSAGSTSTPNAANVVPGKAELVIELRDLSEAKLTRSRRRSRPARRAIAGSTNTTIEIVQTGHYAPALATPAVQSAIERAADGMGLTHMRLPSGAGHDAQMAATLGPMGMIFVPSIGGVSHSPKELHHLGRLRPRRRRSAADGAGSRSPEFLTDATDLTIQATDFTDYTDLKTVSNP